MAVAVEADLTADGAVAELFDEAERSLGPVSILVNNASGWVADTFVPGPIRRRRRPVTVDRNLTVDARAGALLIAELARRHIARGATWGRIVGLTSGGPTGFPGEVSYGAAKAALENYTMSASTELAPFGITANIVHPPVTDTGWVTDEVRAFVAASPRVHRVAARAGRRGHRLAVLGCRPPRDRQRHPPPVTAGAVALVTDLPVGFGKLVPKAKEWVVTDGFCRTGRGWTPSRRR